MACLLIGSGTAKADTGERIWTYNPSSEKITHKDNGLIFSVSAVDSLLTITGQTSALTDSIDLNGRIEDASGKVYTLKAIGNSAFFKNSELVSIILPDELISIGNEAFTACESLTSISLKNVETLGFGSFSATPLTSVDLSAVTEMGKGAFGFCIALEEITLGKNLVSIAKQSFAYCRELTKILCLATTEPTIKENAFANGPATGRKLYAPHATRGWNANDQWGENLEIVYGCDWTLNTANKTLISRDSLITFGVEVTNKNIKLTSLTNLTGSNIDLTGQVGDSTDFYTIRSIGGDVFKDKTLGKVTLPDSLASIQANAFTTSSVDTLVLAGECPLIDGDTLAMINKGACIVRVPDDKLSTYHVEDLPKKSYANWGGMPYILGESGKLATFSYTLGEETVDADLVFPDFKAVKAPIGQLFQFKLVAAADTTYKLKVEGFDGTTSLDSVSYKDSIVSIKLESMPTDFMLKVSLLKPIAATTTRALYIKNAEEYSEAKDGESMLYSGQIGDGKTPLNLSYFTIGSSSSKPSEPFAIKVNQINLDSDAYTMVTQDVTINLFGKNCFASLSNMGNLTFKAGDNTAELKDTKIFNAGTFRDETGQIRSAIDFFDRSTILLAIKSSSSKPEETVNTNGTITLKADAEAPETATLSYVWERLTDDVWTAVPAPVTLKAAADGSELEVAAADAGQYRCVVTSVVNNTVTTSLCNYTTVKVSDPEPPTPPVYYCSITMPLVEGATTSPTFGSYFREEGDSFSFTLKLEEGYSQSKPVVKANGTVIKPNQDGLYIIFYIYTDIEVAITGIEKNTPTGIDNPDDMKAGVWGSNGTMHISTPEIAPVKVYSFAGILLKDLGNVSGNTQVNLGKGTYIVVIGQQSFKCRM